MIRPRTPASNSSQATAPNADAPKTRRTSSSSAAKPLADEPAPLLDLRVAHGVALADLARAGLEPAAGNDAGGAAVGPDEDVERELDALDVLLQERLGHAPRVEAQLVQLAHDVH